MCKKPNHAAKKGPMRDWMARTAGRRRRRRSGSIRAAADGGGHRKPRTEAGDCDGEVGDSVRPRGWRESEVEK